MPMRELPHPAHGRPVAPGQSRGHGPTDGGVPVVGRTERQELSRLGQSFPEPFQGAARLHGDRQVAGTVVQDSVPAADGKDVGHPRRLVSQEPLPAASQDEDRISRAVPLPDPIAARLCVGRFVDRWDSCLQLQPAAGLRRRNHAGSRSDPGPVMLFIMAEDSTTLSVLSRRPGPEDLGGEKFLVAAGKDGGEGWTW